MSYYFGEDKAPQLTSDQLFALQQQQLAAQQQQQAQSAQLAAQQQEKDREAAMLQQQQAQFAQMQQAHAQQSAAGEAAFNQMMASFNANRPGFIAPQAQSGPSGLVVGLGIAMGIASVLGVLYFILQKSHAKTADQA